MDQQDFRKLLSEPSTTSAKAPRNIVPAKRPRGSLLGERAPIKKSDFSPRVVKNSNPFKQALKVGNSTIRSTPSNSYNDRGQEKARVDDSLKDEQIAELDALLADKKITRQEYLDKIRHVGGDIESAGKVKGLDLKLLERVRAGEDVFNKDVEGDEERAEAALEDVLEQKLATEAPMVEDAPVIKPAKNRDSILASLRKPKVQAVSTPASASPKNKILKNKDGTTSETYEEKGRKIKIIRDASGQIIKRLAKKLKEPEKEATEEPEVKATTSEPVAIIDDTDIFEDAGEYSIDAITQDAPLTSRQYFQTEEDTQLLPSTAEEFLAQNRDALRKASAIADRQVKLDQAKFKERQDLGFGLVVDDGAYDLDLRDVPDEEEEEEEKPK